jgi:hypothetical protein
MSSMYAQALMTGVLIGSAWGCFINGNWYGAAGFAAFGLLAVWWDRKRGYYDGSAAR